MIVSTKKFRPGQIVVYVPGHAKGDKNHPDCETGIVSSLNDTNVFVKFNSNVSVLGWDGATAQPCYPDSLVIVDRQGTP